MISRGNPDGPVLLVCKAIEYAFPSGMAYLAGYLREHGEDVKTLFRPENTGHFHQFAEEILKLSPREKDTERFWRGVCRIRPKNNRVMDYPVTQTLLDVRNPNRDGFRKALHRAPTRLSMTAHRRSWIGSGCGCWASDQPRGREYPG